jgi:hypothetical protein
LMWCCSAARRSVCGCWVKCRLAAAALRALALLLSTGLAWPTRSNHSGVP